MYEHYREPLLPRDLFLRRVARYGGLSFAIIAGSLAIGVLGYHFIEGLPWIDALLNASMILGGMGPVAEIRTTTGKIFASFYALYSGLVVLVAAGVLFAPMLHRFLHYFHAEPEAEDRKVESRRRRRS
jgi:hypothetical protein